ncbi:MAG: hypothetical protein B9S32_17735 [Verrucomicrobia bacterium Tous-C9LFEB]|nr:MAG: hypothetical protein B9S32_17735 [Verrucomicrobia bacterium Tous-C9LFEB]
MTFPFRLLFLVALLAATASAWAIEPIVIIKSPDEGESYIYGRVSDRKLRWSDKEKKLYALITVDNSLYSSNTDRPEKETVRFYLPGVEYDAAQKLFYVRGKNNEVIPFATTKKELLFDSIKPVRNAVVRVVRTRGRIEVVAEIYKPEEVVAEEAEQKSSQTNEWQKLDLNKAIGQ